MLKCLLCDPEKFVYAVEYTTEFEMEDESRENDNLMGCMLTANLMFDVWFQVCMCSFVLPTILRNHLFATTIMTQDTTHIKPLKTTW